VVSEEDIEQASSQAPDFVQEFHTIGIEPSDPRAFLFQALRSQADKFEFREAVGRIVSGFLAQNGEEFNGTKYGVCHLFAAVARFYNIEIMADLATLLHHESFIVRVGVLVALEQGPSNTIIVQSVIEMLKDPILIVRYFAANALGSLLKHLPASEGPAVSETNVNDLVELYFTLSWEFQDCISLI
jgi:hypothetical protein